MIIFQRHPLGTFLPNHRPEELVELEESVKTLGLTRPVIIYDNMVLDGWFVYQFALKHDKTLRFEQFTNTTLSALDYRVSTIKGRSLTSGQKAALATEYYEAIKGKSKQNHNQYTPKEKLGPVPIENWSSNKAAKLFKISSGSVNKANTIKKRDPVKFKELTQGTVTLRSAYQSVKTVKPFDRLARKVLNEADFLNYTPPDSVHASDFEIWEFNRYINSLGLSLTLTQAGNTWEAKYTKTQEVIGLGHMTFKAAIFSAGKAAMEKQKVKS
jgi:hypothetical protein